MDYETYTPEDFIQEGNIALGKSDVELAQVIFKKAVELHPKNPTILGACGDFYLFVQKPHLALQYLRKAAISQPFHGSIRYLLGVALCKQARFRAALRELEQAKIILGKTQQEELLRFIGWTLFMLGDTELARKTLEESTAINRFYAPAHIDLASTYFFESDFESGEPHIKRAFELAPNDFFIQTNHRYYEELKKRFDNLSEKTKQKHRNEMKTPEYRRSMRIELLIKGFEISPQDDDDIAEVEAELRADGVDYKKRIIYKRPHF